MAVFWRETFESSGFDNVHSEGETVTGTGVVDEDFAVASVTGAPSNWKSKCIRFVADSAGANMVGHSFTTEHEDSYFRWDIIVKVFPVISSNFSTKIILEQRNNGSIQTINLIIRRRDSLSPNGFNWGWRVNEAGAGLVSHHDTGNDIALDTPYTIESKFKASDNTTEWRINGASPVFSGSLSSTHPQEIQNNFRYGWLQSESGDAAEMFINNIEYDDSQYPGPAPEPMMDGVGRGVGRGVMRGVG